jgi:hypothetical protein
MKKQYKFVTLMALVAFTSAVNGQTPGIREFGIGLANFNSFSLQYRWGNETRLYRISGNIDGASSTSNQIREDSNSGNVDTHTTSDPKNINFGIFFGVLKLKMMNEKFGFMYGGNYGVTYSYNNNITDASVGSTDVNGNYAYNRTITKSSSQSIRPSVGVALGGFYKINPSFLLYAEVIPNIYYLYSQGETNSDSLNGLSHSTNSNNGFGLSNISNSNASLTIVYRWIK